MKPEPTWTVFFFPPITIDELELHKNQDISVKIEIPETAKNVGGITLFGKGLRL